jgi:hypothetical protein
MRDGVAVAESIDVWWGARRLQGSGRERVLRLAIQDPSEKAAVRLDYSPRADVVLRRSAPPLWEGSVAACGHRHRTGMIALGPGDDPDGIA